MARQFAKKFYRSKQWEKTRLYVLGRDFFLCQKCGEPAEEVHHIVWLTSDNINDPAVSLDPDNLMSLCRNCHFDIHRDYRISQSNKQQESDYIFDENGMVIPNKKVYLVTGCYGSGKSHYVKQHMNIGDLVVDMDLLFRALSFQSIHSTPNNLLHTVWDVRDFLYELIRWRKGDWTTAWVIAALPDKEKREKLASDLNARIIEIDTDLETCIRNIEADNTRIFKQDHISLAREYFWKKN